jgi:large subunit ribosomal protein L13
MSKIQPNKLISIDAAGRSLGRVASEVALKLRGKHLPSFTPRVAPKFKVEVINIGQARFTGNKLLTKKYFRFSGYPGGLKVSTLQQEFAKHPDRLFRQMVRRMLPKNKLNSTLLRNLIVRQ